jgi:mono/diheme cytochrome c family protein
MDPVPQTKGHPMKLHSLPPYALSVSVTALCSMMFAACGSGSDSSASPALVAEGREIFRHDTFGDEKLWTDTLRMHEVIAASVDPSTALAVGLKVDADALPPGILESADLEDPATTVALLELGAVVGIEATVENGTAGKVLRSVGVTCALCHSTVDDSVAPGIGRRLDGWPNRDLDPGLILSLSPAMQEPAVQAVLRSWGPGKYDAYFNHDGLSDPTVIPPAYGLRDVPLETFTGEGEVSYWNAYVAVTQMGGQGSFSDPRLGIDIEADPDLVTPKLEALRAYQFSLDAPSPPAGSFDEHAATRGEKVFRGAGECSGCHDGVALTDAADRLHAPEETGSDPVLAERATTGLYRTTPLRGVWQHPPYFHDGSAATLDEVVEHYDGHLALELSQEQKRDLVEYLKSL